MLVAGVEAVPPLQTVPEAEQLPLNAPPLLVSDRVPPEPSTEYTAGASTTQKRYCLLRDWVCVVVLPGHRVMTATVPINACMRGVVPLYRSQWMESAVRVMVSLKVMVQVALGSAVVFLVQELINRIERIVNEKIANDFFMIIIFGFD